jgi:proteasome lid subunit RPN8/RPN11
MLLRLPAFIYLELFALGQDAAPCEACGFILGQKSDSKIIAAKLAPTLNTCILSGEFGISDAEVHRVTQLAARTELDIVAVYHSHLSGLVELSISDVRALRRSLYPWLVIAPSRGELFAYLPTGEPLPLKLDLDA